MITRCRMTSRMSATPETRKKYQEKVSHAPLPAPGLGVVPNGETLVLAVTLVAMRSVSSTHARLHRDGVANAQRAEAEDRREVEARNGHEAEDGPPEPAIRHVALVFVAGGPEVNDDD